MQTICDAKKPLVCICLAYKRNAEGKIVGFESGWNRYCGEVEQVDEVGVVAEVCVEFDRRGLNLFDGVMRWHRWQKQKVYLLPEFCRFAAQGFKLVGGVEGFYSGIFCCTTD